MTQEEIKESSSDGSINSHESDKQIKPKRCYFCKELGHIKKDCPDKAQRRLARKVERDIQDLLPLEEFHQRTVRHPLYLMAQPAPEMFNEFDSFHGLPFTALDCEMVITQIGLEVVRIAVAGKEGYALIKVRPIGFVTDLLTKFTGISEEDELYTDDCVHFCQLQDILQGIGISRETLIIGHGLENDLTSMRFKHDRVIDTTILYAMPGKRWKHDSNMLVAYWRRVGLAELSRVFLKMDIQDGSHDPCIDAHTAMMLVDRMLTDTHIKGVSLVER